MISGYIEAGYQSLSGKLYETDSGQIYILAEIAFLGSHQLTLRIKQPHCYTGIYFKHQLIDCFIFVLLEVLDAGVETDIKIPVMSAVEVENMRAVFWALIIEVRNQVELGYGPHIGAVVQ